MRRLLFICSLSALLVGAGACGGDDADTDAADEVTTTTVGTDTTLDGERDDAVEDAAPDEDAARAVVDAFMDARVESAGDAEEFLTPISNEQFTDDLALYDVASYEIAAVEGADANSFEVTVDVVDENGDERTETLFVGPGETIAGDQEAYVIRGVALS
ncbi:MAG: hypothetical protein JJU45_03705 [Acidimicrobiia bacterium]|nr:hypothetical protein [Acidimicrobiia bacterium]